MARFLSDDWIDEMAAAAAASPALAAAAAGARLTVQQEVEEADGDVARWWVRLDDGAVSFGAGRADHADVVLRTDRATAAAIATGALAAQDALAAGRLRLGGDLDAAVRHAAALAAVDDAFADVRARTAYD